MTLEDIHDVWGEHVKVQQEEEDGAMVVGKIDRHPGKGWARPRPRAGLLLLPSFLHAFADLARAKYCRQEHNNADGGGGLGDGDDGHRVVTRLLLRDVFNNVCTRSVLRVSASGLIAVRMDIGWLQLHMKHSWCGHSSTLQRTLQSSFVYMRVLRTFVFFFPFFYPPADG